MEPWSRTAQKFTIGPRFAHASCAVEKLIFVFGGQKKGFNDDVWSWDCANDEWLSYAPKGTAPSPRVQHTAVFTGREALVFGGYAENVGEVNDLHALDVLHPDREFTWRQPDTSGEPPAKRYGHSATMVGELMVVIAGQSSAEQLADVCSLHTGSYTWSRVDVRGDILLPRTLHSATAMADGTVVLLGGFNRKARNLDEALVLSVDGGGTSASWRALAVDDPDGAFKGRSQHRAVRQANHLLIFGGFDGDKPLNDLLAFDTRAARFHVLPATQAVPEPRCRHTLELVGSELHVLLGYKGEWAVGPDVFTLSVGSADSSLDRLLGTE